MTQRDDFERPTPEDEALARLLRLAGTRPSPPADRAARVRAAVHAEWQRSLPRRRRWPLVLGAGAALAAAAALVVALRGPHVVEPPAPRVAVLERVTGPGAPRASAPGAAAADIRVGDDLAAGTWIETGDGTRVALRLAGGASLRVDASTRVTLDSNARLVLDRGAVYVDAEPRSGAPAIEVHTPVGVARELGTQFEVRLMEPAVRVRVRQGEVRLENEHAREDGTAGQELRAEGREIRRAEVPVHGAPWAWMLDVAPPFTLEGRSLDEFLRWACRENGWTLRFDDAQSSEAASSVILHGSIVSLTPPQAVEAVLPTSGFRHRLDGATLVVGRARRP